MKQKGMSQVLSLIVAATVLLIAAFSVIFMTSGSLGDFGKSITGGSCLETISQSCQVKGIPEIDAPKSCYEENARGELEAVEALKTSSYSYSITEDEQTVQCQ